MQSGKSVGDGARVIEIGPLTIRVVLSSGETGGGLEIFEFTAPAGAPGPVMHTHATARETFHVLSGGIRMVIDGQVRDVVAGDVAHVAPNVAHRFEYPGPDATRMLVIFTPAVGMDRYFEELRELAKEGWPPSPRRVVEVMGRYDVQLVRE